MEVLNQEEKPQEWRCVKCEKVIEPEHPHWIARTESGTANRTCMDCYKAQQKRK